ncbi:MAG: hypothetical protein J6565_08215 [Lactobacillus sp.]|nr:hypothetical protein [Lactobacillus sp.]
MMSAMRTTIKEQIGILLIGLLTGIILTHFFPDLYIVTVVFLENLAGQVNGELIKERIGILLIGFLIGIVLTHFFPDLYNIIVALLEDLAVQFIIELVMPVIKKIITSAE